MSVTDSMEEALSPKSAEDDGAREMIDQLTRSDGNDICADCGDRSEYF